MNRPIVYMRAELPEAWTRRLRQRCAITDEPTQAVAAFTLLTERIDEAFLEAAPNLRVVSNMAVGVDNIDVSACTARGIFVGNTPGVLTEATADLTWALILAAARGLPTAMRDAAEGRWTTWSPTGWLGIDLAGATLGIVGMGKIGGAVAARARGFGMEVIHCRPTPLAELLPRADVVSIHVPLTPETENMFDAQTIASMKPGAILVNTARGCIVDPDALAGAVQGGHLRAAALDVTDPEPLPPDHRLFSTPGVHIAPHIGSATEGTRRRMAELACDNILADLDGRPLPHCVNPAARTQPGH